MKYIFYVDVVSQMPHQILYKHENTWRYNIATFRCTIESSLSLSLSLSFSLSLSTWSQQGAALRFHEDILTRFNIS